jgi:hypothetical protein
VSADGPLTRAPEEDREGLGDPQAARAGDEERRRFDVRTTSGTTETTVRRSVALKK